jgi:hypothetical protein
MGQQALEGGDDEGRRLAGTGLGLPGDILPRQGDWQGFGLDGGAVLETRVSEALEDTWIEIEAGKAGGGQMCLGHEFGGSPARMRDAAVKGLQIFGILAEIASYSSPVPGATQHPATYLPRHACRRPPSGPRPASITK